jgi:uncharacterized protein (TIGR00369 family)
MSLLNISTAKTNVIRDLWNRLEKLPGGRRVFSRLIGTAAPYTATVGARVEVLTRGHCEVTMRDRRAVRNHLSCVHAIALTNLAEVAGNVALAYAMPDDARFIVAGIEIEYLKKARGTIRARCDCPIPTSSARTEYRVPVSLENPAGEVVARATLRTLVGPKPAA